MLENMLVTWTLGSKLPQSGRPDNIVTGGAQGKPMCPIRPGTAAPAGCGCDAATELKCKRKGKTKQDKTAHTLSGSDKKLQGMLHVAEFTSGPMSKDPKTW